MDYNLNIAKFKPKRDEGSEESGKFGLARHYKERPLKTVSFQDNLQSAVFQLHTGKKNSQSISIFNVKKGDTLSHIAVHLLKKNKQKVTSEAINQMVSNIALRNKIQNPDLIFPGQKLVLEYERGVTGNFDAVLKGPEKTQNQSLSISDKGNSENLLLAKQRAKKNQSELVPLYAQSSIQPYRQENHFLLEKTLERAAVKGYIPTDEIAAVKEKIQLMADSFKFSPDDFAKVVLMESDGFNPKASNGRCHGIIQFCDGDDRGAASIGLSHEPEKILELGVVDQLDLVAQYFEDTELKSFGPASIDDLYLTILSPAARQVTDINYPLPIAGRQARVLHVGGITEAPITRASIKNGLIQHASEKLKSFFSESLNISSVTQKRSIAYSSDYFLKNRY